MIPSAQVQMNEAIEFDLNEDQAELVSAPQGQQSLLVGSVQRRLLPNKNAGA